MRETTRLKPWMIGVASILILCGIAWAIKPFRSSAGVQMVAQSSWQGDTGVSGVYYKTATGIVARNPDNTETTLGAGGSTGNYSFSTNTMDLTGAATMSIAPTTATAITLGQSTTVSSGKNLTLTSGSLLGTYTIAGTPTIGATQAVGTDNTYSIGDSTHRIATLGVKNISGGASATALFDDSIGTKILYGTDRIYLDVLGTNEMDLIPNSNAGNYFALKQTSIAPDTDFTLTIGSSTKRFLSAFIGHLIAGAATKPACTPGTGAGTGGTCQTLSGSTDIAGTLEVVAGTTPAGSANVATVTFNVAYGSAPRCVFSPSSSTAAGLFGVDSIYIDQSAVTTALFILKNGTVTGIAGSTTYDWNYNCVQ